MNSKDQIAAQWLIGLILVCLLTVLGTSSLVSYKLGDHENSVEKSE